MKVGEYEIKLEDWQELQENPIIEWYLEEVRGRLQALEQVRDNPLSEERVSRAATFRVQGINDALEIWHGVGKTLEADIPQETLEQEANAIYGEPETVDSRLKEILHGPAGTPYARRRRAANE